MQRGSPPEAGDRVEARQFLLYSPVIETRPGNVVLVEDSRRQFREIAYRAARERMAGMIPIAEHPLFARRGRMMRVASTVILALAILTAAHAQDTTIVARVGDAVITQGEFVSRYALGIFPYKDIERLEPVVRRQFLYSLIGEKLLAAEARRRGVDREERFVQTLRSAEARFIRDKLYRDSVRARVTVTDAEVRRRFTERTREIEFRFLFCASDTEAVRLQRLLDAGVPFDTLLTARQESEGPYYPMPSAGSTSLEPEIQQAIRRLRPGDISPPIGTPSGYYIIRRLEERTGPAAGEELRSAEASSRDEIRREREAERAIRFVADAWQGRKATVTPGIYKAIGTAFAAVTRRMAADRNATILQLSGRHVDSLRAACGGLLDSTFALIGRDRYMTGEFIDDLEARSFRFRASDARQPGRLFRSMVKDMLDIRIVTSLGYSLNLQRAPEVIRDLGLWTVNGLAQSFPEDLWEQFVASDDSVWAFFVANAARFGSVPEVKIAEVLNADSSVMGDVMAQFQKGASMKRLAVAYSQRPGIRDQDGEIGYFPVTEYGIIGRTAFGLSIADRSPLLRVPEGFSFFQLLDKRYPGKSVLRGMTDVRRELESRFKTEIVRRKVDALVKKLAGRIEISVDEAVLENISVVPGQMFTIRYLGFGGNVPAVPGVMPVYEAVLEGMSVRVQP